MVAPVDDQQVLDAPDDEKFVVGEEAQISGSQPRAFWWAAGCGDKLCAESVFSVLGFPPIADGDIVAVHPDLTGRSGWTLDAGLGIDDAHHRRPRDAVADQRRTASAFAPLGMARGQFLGVER